VISSAQGSRVYWGGRYIGSIVKISISQAVGSEFDCTNLGSPIVGSGADSRVVQQVEPVSISPAVVTMELLGGPQFVRDEIGRTKLLRVQTRGGALNGLAYLASFTFDVSTGEKLKNTATFKHTGA
jgi:hypothetical protein